MFPSFTRRQIARLIGLPIFSRSSSPSSVGTLPDTKEGGAIWALPSQETVHAWRASGNICSLVIGKSYYERVSKRDRFLPSLPDAVGNLWQLVPGRRLNVRDFGAKGDGVADDAIAIQAAIDCAVYSPGAPRTVWLPAGTYRIGNTLHLGYGENFTTIRLEGDPFYWQQGRMGGSSQLIPTFTDRPALNIQGGRSVHIHSVTILGPNIGYLSQHYDKMSDRTDKRAWFGPNLLDISDRKYGPFAGITIDGYSGSEPIDGYPEVVYPEFTEITSQYKKNFSSLTTIENCQIYGFVVGVADQPCIIDGPSNGDFVNIRDSEISYNIVGLALCQRDARCTNIFNTRMHFNFTSIDGVNYGTGVGHVLGLVAGSSFDNNVRIFDVNIAGRKPTGGGSLLFNACYGEGCYSIGRFLPQNGTRHVGGVVFQQCKFQFSLRQGEFSPINYIEGRGGVATFETCQLLGGTGIFQFDCDVVWRSMAREQHAISDAVVIGTPAGRTAATALVAFLAPVSLGVSIRADRFFSFEGEDISNQLEILSSDRFPICTKEGARKRAVPIPWWVTFLYDGHSLFEIQRLYSFEFDRSAFPLSRLRTSDTEAGFDVSLLAFPPAFRAVETLPGAVGPGDLARDIETGHAYFIEAVISNQLSVHFTLRRLTGIRTVDYGKTFTADEGLPTGQGRISFLGSRFYYPTPSRVTLFGRAGQHYVALHTVGRTGRSVVPEFVSPADIIIVGIDLVLVVASVDLASKIIYLTGPLVEDIDVDCPAFVRR